MTKYCIICREMIVNASKTQKAHTFGYCATEMEKRENARTAARAKARREAAKKK